MMATTLRVVAGLSLFAAADVAIWIILRYGCAAGPTWTKRSIRVSSAFGFVILIGTLTPAVCACCGERCRAVGITELSCNWCDWQFAKARLLILAFPLCWLVSTIRNGGAGVKQ